MERSPCLYLRLQRPDSARYFEQMHLRKQTIVLPITATVPRGPSHITSHACRPDLVDQRWVIKRANNMLPEAYFSPSAICTLGYWVPKKCGKWNFALKWTWWRSPMQSESIGFHIDVPWAICWIPCVVKCPQFRLNIILIDLLLNQLFLCHYVLWTEPYMWGWMRAARTWAPPLPIFWCSASATHHCSRHLGTGT